jgi:hypothetical protein
VWTGFVWLRIAIIGESCEFVDEPSVSINFKKLSSGFTTGGLWNRAQFHRVSFIS